MLASLAGLAFIVIITLLLCKFQCQVRIVFSLYTLYLFSAQVGGGARSLREGEAGVHTATTSTSPLSARELVEISLLRSADTEDDMDSMDRPGPEAGLVSVPASGSVLSNYPLLISADRQINNTSGNIPGIFYLS